MTLSEYLTQKELTQSAFAASINVSSEAVNQWLKGKRFPRPESIRDIERATDGAVSAADWYATKKENAAFTFAGLPPSL